MCNVNRNTFFFLEKKVMPPIEVVDTCEKGTCLKAPTSWRRLHQSRWWLCICWFALLDLSVFCVFVDFKIHMYTSERELFPCTYAASFHIGPMSFTFTRGTSGYGSQPLTVLRGSDGVTTVKESMTPTATRRRLSNSHCDDCSLTRWCQWSNKSMIFFSSWPRSKFDHFFFFSFC